jgi:hypothetical protein
MDSCDVLRTVHVPVTAVGCSVKDAYGMRLARATDPVLAHAMAELINAGARTLTSSRPRARVRAERREAA